MTEIEFKFYRELKSSDVPAGQIPAGVKNSLVFKNLLEARIIDARRSGRGSLLYVKNSESFSSFYNHHFSDLDETTISKSSNIRRLRDSKARRVESKPLFLLRGFKKTIINELQIDLRYYTETFGQFSVVKPSLESEKVCFVENLASFLAAEHLFGNEWIYIHKYGRIGTNSLALLEAKQVIVFVDYDFNGLDEYLRIKSRFPDATLYLPENFEILFNDYSKQIKGQQKQSKRVAASSLPEVVMIRELVAKTNYFLEQEILIND
jgi:5S rRNA maturation endonuclease (ribonuclease M5)